MLLDEDAFRQFIEREKKQGGHLTKALMGRHQKIYQNPKFELRRLSARQRVEMMSANPHARIRWMRTLGGYLCAEVGATVPDYIPKTPIYHVTILDRRQCLSVCKSQHVIDWEWDDYQIERRERVEQGRRPPPPPWEDPTIGLMQQAYQRAVSPLRNCVGMIEPAFYVYAARELGWNYIAHYHAHCLSWGDSEDRMRRVCKRMAREIHPLVPYAKAVDFRRVSGGDLLQLIRYMCKSPRKQHQLFRRAHSLKQFKGAINGVNAVSVEHAC